MKTLKTILVDSHTVREDLDVGNAGLCVALLCASVGRVAVEALLLLVVVFIAAHVNLQRGFQLK